MHTHSFKILILVLKRGHTKTPNDTKNCRSESTCNTADPRTGVHTNIQILTTIDAHTLTQADTCTNKCLRL